MAYLSPGSHSPLFGSNRANRAAPGPVGAQVALSTVFAGQKVGVKQVGDKIWLVSFMDYDLGFFDEETTRLEPIANPFEANVFVRNKTLPMSPE